jgi:hypothetical protein
MLEEEAEEADNGKDNVDEIKTITRNYRRFNNYSRKFSAGGGSDIGASSADSDAARI